MTLKADTYELKSRNSVRISPIEFELLRTFVLNPDRILSADYLLERVWGGEEDADESEVALYVRYLCSKLRAIGSSVVILDAGDGYCLGEGGNA